MKFSIRDLFLVTVIVAVCVAWGLDHWRQAGEIQEYESIEVPFTGAMSDIPVMPLKEWRQQQKEWKEGDERLEKMLNGMTQAQADQFVREHFGMPIPSAPTPTPPKP